MDNEIITSWQVENLPCEEFLKLVEGRDVNKLRTEHEGLIFALVFSQRLDIIERLENLDINIKDSCGDTPLHMCYHVGIAKFFLERGADVNAKNMYRDIPLHRYIQGTEPPGLVPIFLEYGADINTRNSYTGTLLKTACLHSSIEMVEFLLENGAKIDYNEEGKPECLIFENDYIHPLLEEIEELIQRYQGKNIKSVKRGK